MVGNSKDGQPSTISVLVYIEQDLDQRRIENQVVVIVFQKRMEINFFYVNFLIKTCLLCGSTLI